MSSTSSEFCYVEVARGGAHNRNQVVTLEALATDTNGIVDCFATYFRFTEDFKHHVETTGSVRGYTGVRHSDCLPFDFDNAHDPAAAQQEAVALVRELQVRYEVSSTDLSVFFSGYKGFNVLLCGGCFGGFEPSAQMPRYFKALARVLGSTHKYDPTIYDGVRLLRLPNTVNSKSGLHKIPITCAELFTLSIQQIQDLARQPRHNIPPPDPTLRPTLQQLYQDTKATVDADLARPPAPSGRAPSGLPPCLSNVLARGVGQGQPSRDMAAYVLARQWLLRGLPEPQVLLLLSDWDRLNQPPLGETYLREKLRSALEHPQDTSFRCELFQEALCHNEPDCVLTRQVEQRCDQLVSGVIPQATAVAPPTAPSTTETSWPFSEPASTLLAEPDESVDWVVEHLIEKPSLGFIGGEPKMTKSITALHLALCVVTGTPVFGQFQVPHPGKVFYLQEEDGRRRVKRRMKALLKGMGAWPPPEDFGTRLKVAIRKGFRIDDPEWRRRLDVELTQLQPDLIVFDVLANLHSKEENEQQAMSEIVSYFRDIRDRYGCAVLIVHHFGKVGGAGGFVRPNQRLRGSSVLAAASENSLYLSATPEKLIRVDHESKEGPVDPFLYAVEGSWDAEEGMRLVHKGEAGFAHQMANAETFYTILCQRFDVAGLEGCTYQALAKASSLKEGAIRERMKLLLSLGKAQESTVEILAQDKRKRKVKCFTPIREVTDETVEG